MSEDVKLRRRNESAATPVSNIFIDKYMTDANGEYVKVYLYLLRCINADLSNLSISDIADHFETTEKDVKRALQYWEKMKLLNLEYTGKKLTSIDLLDIREEEEMLQDTVQLKKKTVSRTKSEPSNISEFRTSSADEEELQMLLFVTEKYLGKTLSPTEIDKIIYFRDSLQFSSELIEYLIEHCVSAGYKNMRSIEKIALSWHEEGISTPDEARTHSLTHSKVYAAIVHSLGISGRMLNSSELGFVSKWINSYHFNEDIIREACNRTIEFTGQASFKYADCILDRWAKAGVTALDDIKVLDEKHNVSKTTAKNTANTTKVKKISGDRNRFNNFSQRDYDYNSLEKQLLGNVGNGN
ncbi:MAG: DnaD domain protein [Lachnospiraceae bacterium]|nr:DnaD domain protein [Lachnospiraceae bacterium]